MPNEWTWRPELGRWTLAKYGYPAAPALIDVSTRLVEGRHGYDFWRDIAFTDFTADPGPLAERRLFRAAAKGLTWDEADFFHTRSDAVSGYRDRHQVDRDGLDGISVGLVIRGQRSAQIAGDEQAAVTAGNFFVYDARETSKVAWSPHEVMYLVLRRSEVQSALGGAEPSVAQLQVRLHRTSWRQVVADQFRLLARHMQSVDAAGRMLLLEQVKQSTLVALSTRDGAEPAAGPALFQAALRHIERHLADPDLSAEGIARALRCSRATLYRAFTTHGVGIAETIRDRRLEEVRRALELGEPDRSVADIAAQFGLYDSANFSRQFRQRFGVPPSEIRRRGR